MAASLIVAAMLAFSANAGENVMFRGNQGSLFWTDYKSLVDYRGVTGAMIYQPSDDDRFTKGFRPETSLSIRGKWWREIYDYPLETTALGVYTDVVDKLKSSGFEEIFTCQGTQCGDVGGWQVHLSGLIGGPIEKQYYLAASAKTVGDKHGTFVSLYVNELDGQTRLLVDLVESRGDDTPPAMKQDKPHGQRGALAIYFEKGTTNWLDYEASHLSRLVARGQDLGEASIIVLGHTDSDGAKLDNYLLSRKRAERVKRLLSERYNVSPPLIRIYAMGASMPAQTHTGESNKSRNRRADIFIAKENGDEVAAN